MPGDPIAQVRSLLGRKILVNTLDGRSFEGIFVCLDTSASVLLQSVDVVYRVQTTGSRIVELKTFVALVNIPGTFIRDCQLTPSAD